MDVLEHSSKLQLLFALRGGRTPQLWHPCTVWLLRRRILHEGHVSWQVHTLQLGVQVITHEQKWSK